MQYKKTASPRENPGKKIPEKGNPGYLSKGPKPQTRTKCATLKPKPSCRRNDPNKGVGYAKKREKSILNSAASRVLASIRPKENAWYR
jgi:hypothetical protein